MKKEKLKFRMQKNPYILTTFALGLLSLLMIIGNIVEANAINKNENAVLCSVVSGTPAWASDGKLIGYGSIISEDTSLDIIETELIPNRIKLLYTPSCSACERQIEYFKELGGWDEYEKEGLAIDCSKY